jgi:prophage regulatory protein
LWQHRGFVNYLRGGEMQKLLKLYEVAELLNVCKSQVYNLVKQGYLPKPIKIGKRGSAWLQSDIDSWFKSKIEEREMEVNHG